jgi:hypothetical protein
MKGVQGTRFREARRCSLLETADSGLRRLSDLVIGGVPSETPNPSSDTAQQMMETVTNETKRLELVT